MHIDEGKEKWWKVKESLIEYVAFSWACKDVQNVSKEQLGDKENRDKDS